MSIFSSQVIQPPESRKRTSFFSTSCAKRWSRVLRKNSSRQLRPVLHRFFHDMQFRLGSESRLHVIPPDEFWPSASPLNKKEGGADACPNDSQISPGVVGEKLEGVNSGENER